MADIFISATSACEAQGGKITGSWSAASVQNATVTINGINRSFTDNRVFTSVSGGSFVFDSLLDDLYELTVTGTINGVSNLLEINISCGPPPPSCDLTITSVTTLKTTDGKSNGRATINATGTGTIQYSLNGQDWQSSNVFFNLPIGAYTAYIQKQNQVSCGDQKGFIIEAAPVSGCTNPDALNYNPAATTDNGSCMYASKFYACGGVLPNPVFISVNLSVFDGAIEKGNHYVKLNLYKVGESSPFATSIQSLRNGSAQIDVSGYLRTEFNNAYQEPTAQVVYRDDAQSFGFYLGIIEHFNGAAQPERLRTMPPRVAVNAALEEYTDNIDPYLIQGISGIAEPTGPEL